mmetsp:Transcript_30149/g.95088  ORF Transcript_30149/g.95088 Transcript_30149/m.95088 type:complete len:82 (+) Transcript_30149:1-246(+)
MPASCWDDQHNGHAELAHGSNIGPAGTGAAALAAAPARLSRTPGPSDVGPHVDEKQTWRGTHAGSCFLPTLLLKRSPPPAS